MLPGMTCASCGTAAGPGAKFCAECGSPLASGCPGCGAEVSPAAKFCPSCGTSLRAAAAPLPRTEATGDLPEPDRPAPVAERRLVSVLFADLVGFTGLSESRDAEEVRDATLACAGTLNANAGGPPVIPPLAPDEVNALGEISQWPATLDPRESLRRSV